MLDVKTKELGTANEKLHKANKELEQFAYVASHDLQEPLKTVSMFVNIVEVDLKKNERSNVSQYFAFINDSVNRMSQKIFSLLEYSRIGSKSSLCEVNTKDILKEVLSDLKKSVDESNAKIKVGELPIMQGYKIEMQILFQNLISNALKFMPEGRSPRVEIECKQVDTNWLFSVKDNGIGIDKKHNKKIFLIFKDYT